MGAEEDLETLDQEAAGHKAEIRRHRQALQECREKRARYVAGLKRLGIGSNLAGGDSGHGQGTPQHPRSDR
ncbi:MAG: hypothetical protein AAB368_03460 [bacterium]